MYKKGNDELQSDESTNIKYKDIDEYIKWNTKVRSLNSLIAYKCWLKHLFNYYNLKFDDSIPVDEFKNIIFNISEEDYTDIITYKDHVHYNRALWINQVTRLFSNSVVNRPIKLNLEYKLKYENIKLHFIKKEELELLYDNADDKIKLVMLLFLTTGMRLSALCKIRNTDIDLNENTIKTIEKGNKVITFVITLNKIKELIQSTNYFERPYIDRTIYKKIKNLCKKCNIVNHKHIHPHSFRHTFAKILINTNVSINDVKQLLGHNDIKMTEQFYLKETIKDVTNRVNLIWNQNKINVIDDIVPYFLKNKDIKFA